MQQYNKGAFILFKFSSKSVVLLISSIFLFFSFFGLNNKINIPQKEPIEMNYSDFIKNIERKNINNVSLQNIKGGVEIYAQSKQDTRIHVIAPEQDVELIKKLNENNVIINVLTNETNIWLILFYNLITHLLPFFFLLLLLNYLMRSQGSSRIMSFGKTNAHKNTEKNKVTFKDVAGTDEAKEELKEIIDFLKNPKKFEELGGRMPKGVLLFGKPGTGKTLLARAVAGEANCAFFSASGSEFVEMFVGVGASRVRDLFEQAKNNLPCIIFIDEIDAIGKKRNNSLGSNDEKEQTLNELLLQLDGFKQNKGLMIFGATNRADVLDPALLRSGRFDRKIHIDMPALQQRKEILEVHAKKIKLNEAVKFETIARATPGFSGADLANLLNEAALLAGRTNKISVDQEDIENAIDKIMMGPEQKSRKLSEEDKKLTAYHEAGHAIISFFSNHSENIHKVTIIPRGAALGMVVHLPSEELNSYTKEFFIDNLAICMGGRAAEELIFGEKKITTGASSDIQQATKMAEKMILSYGMNEKTGMRNYNKEEYYERQLSQETAQLLDKEISLLLNNAYLSAKQILLEKIDLLHKLANTLLEKEILTLDEIKEVLQKQII